METTFEVIGGPYDGTHSPGPPVENLIRHAALNVMVGNRKPGERLIAIHLLEDLPEDENGYGKMGYMYEVTDVVKSETEDIVRLKFIRSCDAPSPDKPPPPDFRNRT